MKLKNTKINDLKIIIGKKHSDKRGHLRELLSEKFINKNFKFHIVSKSKKNVLRGLHFQKNKPQGKYISVIKGKIFDVIVDIRKKSKTFGKSFSIVLSDNNCKSLYVPPGFAHGFLTLGNENIITYSCSEYRSIGNEYVLYFNDPFLKIKWPTKSPIITSKDKNGKKFKELFKI